MSFQMDGKLKARAWMLSLSASVCSIYSSQSGCSQKYSECWNLGVCASSASATDNIIIRWVHEIALQKFATCQLVGWNCFHIFSQKSNFPSPILPISVQRMRNKNVRFWSNIKPWFVGLNDDRQFKHGGTTLGTAGNSLWRATSAQ